MINTIQEREIAVYLISKRLSPSLFLEIKDHFVQQTSDLMNENEMNFQEAFLQVKLNWQYELEMIKADTFSFKKIARIEKKILQNRFKVITVSALAFSMILSLLLLIDQALFFYMEIILLGMMAGMLGYSFIIRKMKFSVYMQLSFHPLVLRNIVGVTVLFSSLYFLWNEFDISDFGIAKVFFIYAMSTKIQLLYYNTRKINVLI